MIRFTILLIAASCAYGLPKGLGGQEGRIMGGSKAEPGQFPYQAEIILDGEHYCGGVIVGKKWILTVQHCVNWFAVEQYTIKVGTTTLDHGGDVYSVKRIVKHDNYVITSQLNDIALMETNTDITFNDNVKVIPLDSWIIDPDSDVVVSGWGLTDRVAGSTFSNDLQFINIKTISTEECAKNLPWMAIDPDRQFCTSNVDGEGAFLGDEGGPIVHDGQLRGLIIHPVWQFTDIHLDVSGYADWIIGTMDWD